MKSKRLLQIELILSDGTVANVSRSDSGEILVHLAFDTPKAKREDNHYEAVNAFTDAEKVINK